MRELIINEHTSISYAPRTYHNASQGVTLAIATDFTTAGEKLTHKAAKGKIVQIVLKYKNNGKEEVVGSSFDKDEVLQARDHYSEHEDNTNIYYLVQSVPIPKVKGRIIK